MTNKQKRFCDEYLIDLNATQAAIRAGYSEKTSYSIGIENLKKPEIREYIDKQLATLHSERIADAQEVMEYLTSVLRGDARSEMVVTSFAEDGSLNTNFVDRPPDEKEKLKAAELLGKRHGLFTEKLDLSKPVKIIINDDYGSNE